MKPVVRAGVHDDAPAIARLEEMDAASVLATLSTPAAVCFVIDVDGVIAHVIGSAAADQGEVDWLYVHPSHRRRGLAHLLLDALDDEWRRRGIVEAWLEVRRDNAQAIALYTARGWLEHSVRRAYYRDGADALVYRLSLDGSPRSS